MKRREVLVLLWGFAVAGAAVAASPPPKLVVAISVDQFAAGLYEQYRTTYTGGLRRLAEEGVTFPSGYQSHAATETCPGHSTILTGRHPSGTGIIANNWRSAATGKDVYCVSDASVSVPGRPGNPRGPANLRVTTLGDWMFAANPASRVIAVSGKDRAAITMAGQQPTAVFWWEEELDFVTYVRPGEDAARKMAPVREFNATLDAVWSRRPPAGWPSARRDCARLDGEGIYGGLTLKSHVPPTWMPATPDKPWREDRAFQTWFRATPEFDRITLDLAYALVRQFGLGKGAAPDLLAVSLSATDYVGHRHGNQGPEMCNQLAALDAQLGRFLARLDALRVPYAVVLTADHGAIDAPERVSQRGFAAERLESDVVADVNGYLRRTQGASSDAFRGNAQELYLAASDLAPAARDKLVAAALAHLRQRADVVAAFDKTSLLAVKIPKGKPVDELTLEERFAESVDAERSPDILMAVRPYATLGRPRGPENYIASHGSPWNYDRRVPILFWWKGIHHAEQYLPVETVDIAPTLAALLGIKTPEVDGRCLVLDVGSGDRCSR